MATIVSELRVQKALASRVPRSAELKIEPGDKFRIYRETDKKYIGPYPVIRVDGKQLFIKINDREVQFSVHQAIQASTYHTILNGERLVHTLPEVLPKFSSTRESTKPDKKRTIPTVHITEVLHHMDPRTRFLEANKARELEIENLVRRGTWEMVLEEDVPKDANMITGSFFVTFEDVETEKPTFKARFVAHGNRDSDKDQFVHDSTTVRQSSVRLLVAIAAIMGFDVWTEDISQAYLQSASELLRELYLKPNRQLKVPAGYVLKLLRPLYGLADSGDYWHATFAKHLSDDLAMKPVASDISRFFRRTREQVTGLLASYVDE